MSSGLPSMFKSPKNRSFDYKPVFYDEQKERKKELERMAEEYRTGDISDERRLERMRGSLGRHRSSGGHSVRSKDSAARTIRLISVFILLLCLLWVVFYWA